MSAEKGFPFLKVLKNTDWAIQYLEQVYMRKMRNGQTEHLTLVNPDQLQESEKIWIPQS